VNCDISTSLVKLINISVDSVLPLCRVFQCLVFGIYAAVMIGFGTGWNGARTNGDLFSILHLWNILWLDSFFTTGRRVCLGQLSEKNSIRCTT
jgi:hypothetical protein